MIRLTSFNSLSLTTLGVSLLFRLEPQDAEVMIASGRQLVAGWHVLAVGLIGAAGVRRRTSSTWLDTEFARAGILRGPRGPYLAATKD